MSGEVFDKVASKDSDFEALGKIGDQSSDIEEFFSTAELAKLSDYEKNRYRNIRRNYEMMVSVGLPARKPDFMEKRASRGRARARNTKRQRDSDSDEEWTPDNDYQRSSKRDRRKVIPFSVPRKTTGKKKSATQSVIREEIACLNRTKATGESTLTEAKHSHRYPLRELPQQNYMDLEAPNDDDFIFCEDCNREHEGDCPLHGPYVIVNDTMVPADCLDNERPLQSLPAGLVVRSSGIPNAGLGVWAIDTIPVRTRFGPYLGDITQDADEAHSTGYSWQIYYHGKPKHFVNAYGMKNSNWMRYVNCARSESEQNLVAFQYRGQIYYRTYKEIKPGTELLVWYGHEYGKELGIIRKKLEIAPKFVNGVEMYRCPWCTISLGTLDFLSKHCKFKHGQLVGTDPNKKKYEGDEIYKCGKCDVCYSYVDYLVSHMKRVHKETLHLDDLQYKKLIFSPSAVAEQRELHKEYKKNLSELSGPELNHASRGSMEERMQVTFDMLIRDHDAESPIPIYFSQKKRVCLRAKDIVPAKKNKRKESRNEIYRSNKHIFSSTLKETRKKHLKIHTDLFKLDISRLGTSSLTDLDGFLQESLIEKVMKKENNGHDIVEYDLSSRSHIKDNQTKMTHSGHAYECDKAGYGAAYLSHLVTHQRTHTGEKPYKCDECGYSTAQLGNLQTNQRTHTGEKPYKCDECGYSTADLGNLQTHQRTHTGEKPYKCDECGYSTGQLGHLKRHQRTHTGEKPYKCDECGYSTAQLGDLKTHQRTHTGEKLYKCDECGYSTTVQSALKKHQRTHTGEKPYKCDECGYSTAQLGDLKRHQRTHTGEKPYKCDECGYSTTVQSALKTHQRTHTGEKPCKCDECGYSTAQLGDLKKHQRTHTGEKPYTCDECGYSTTIQSALKTHQRTHTGEKPYKCDEFGYSTAQLGDLKKHQRTQKRSLITYMYKCDEFGYSTAQFNNLMIHQRTHQGTLT